jgi:hypothetical protein
LALDVHIIATNPQDMKNNLLIFALFIGFAFSFGNVSTIAAQGSKYTYCELVGSQMFLSNKVMVAIDFGQETKFFQSNIYKDEQTGKPKIFNSMVDALNFMGEKGWEFVQAYVVTASNQNVYRWLLRSVKTE